MDFREGCSGRRYLMMLHDSSTPYHAAEADSVCRTDSAPISRRFTAAGLNLPVWDALKVARMPAPESLVPGLLVPGLLAPWLLAPWLPDPGMLVDPGMLDPGMLDPGMLDIGSGTPAGLGSCSPCDCSASLRSKRAAGRFRLHSPCTKGPGARLGEKCGLAVRRSPAGVTDAPAPLTFPSPLMPGPAARGGPCELRPRATRPVSARLSRITTAASLARPELSSSTGRTVRDARSRSTHAPNLPLNRGRLQTWTDWINEWTCDQGNERTVGSGTIRV